MKRSLSTLMVAVFALVFAAKVQAELEHVASIHLGSRYEKIVEREGYWYLAGQ